LDTNTNLFNFLSNNITDCYMGLPDPLKTGMITISEKVIGTRSDVHSVETNYETNYETESF
jgi:hypothetical protein